MRLLALLIVLVAVLAAVPKPGPVSAETPPHDQWLAYEGRLPGEVNPILGVMYSTPEVAVFQDGRIVWLDTMHWRLGDGQNPFAWRSAVLTYRERSDFKRILTDSEFFTVDLPPGTVGEDLPRSGRTYIGGHMLHKTRNLVIMSRYVPESLGSRRYFARANEVVDALRCMTQRVSDCYKPDRIRVGAFEGLTSGASPTVDWPVSVKPGLENGKLVEYSGEEAHKIIDTLAVSTMVTIGGKGYTAAWAPVLDVPSPLPTEIPARNSAPLGEPTPNPGNMSPYPHSGDPSPGEMPTPSPSPR